MRFYIGTGCKQRFILKEISVLDSLRDLGEILVNNPAGSHIQMSDFGIPHLSFRKPYGHTACVSPNKRILCH